MSAPPLRPGQRLELEPVPPSAESLEVEVVRTLDAGEHSAAWLARGPASQPLVLKTTLGKGRGLDADLQVEERVLRQVGSHPNLVALRGVGHAGVGQGPERVLAFERAFPNPLLLASRPHVRACFSSDPGTRWFPLPAPLAGDLALDLLLGLAHMHARGFVHCDVKPSHLLVRLASPREEAHEDEVLAELSSGRTRGLLIDAGGARSSAYLRELSLGQVAAWELGQVPPQLTPTWAPPEALLPGPDGRPWLHPSLDVYAGALTIYAHLTGRAPYDHLGLPDQALADMRALKQEERTGALFPISHQAVAGVPGLRRVAADLYALLAACLQRDPLRRPSAEQALQRLQALRARGPLGLRS